MLEILKTFEKIINKKFNIIKSKPRPGDTEKLVCDNQYINSVLNLKIKKTTFLKSISNAINWKKKVDEK